MLKLSLHRIWNRLQDDSWEGAEICVLLFQNPGLHPLDLLKQGGPTSCMWAACGPEGVKLWAQGSHLVTVPPIAL